MRGQRRHRLTLYRRASNASDTQHDEATDEAVATVWASVEFNGGDETTQGERRRGMEALLIKGSWGPSLEGLDSSWWTEVNGKPAHFSSAVKVWDRGGWKFHIKASQS